MSQPERHDEADVEIVTCRTVPGSELVTEWANRVGQVGILAIDLEGMDHTVLQEVFSGSPSRPDLILVEALTDEDRSIQAKFLESQGYMLVRNLQLSNLSIRGSAPSGKEDSGGSSVDTCLAVTDLLSSARNDPMGRCIGRPALRRTAARHRSRSAGRAT